jgi:vacuolar-type H+-ATPase subunit I/STV1
VLALILAGYVINTVINTVSWEVAAFSTNIFKNIL